MAKEKLSNEQKKGIAALNPSGKSAIDALSQITGVCNSTVYKAKREGTLLNQVDAAEKKIRELIVQTQLIMPLTSTTKNQETSGLFNWVSFLSKIPISCTKP